MYRCIHICKYIYIYAYVQVDQKLLEVVKAVADR